MIDFAMFAIWVHVLINLNIFSIIGFITHICDIKAIFGKIIIKKKKKKGYLDTKFLLKRK